MSLNKRAVLNEDTSLQVQSHQTLNHVTASADFHTGTHTQHMPPSTAVWVDFAL